MAAAATLLAACSGGVWDARGPVAAADRQITLDALAIMLVIVVPTLAAALAFAWWYRAANPRARRLPDWVYSGRIELLVWSIPLLTIMFLGGVIWIGSHRLDPRQPIPSAAAPLEVQVVSLDWKWLFIYPAQGIAAVNQLVVPAGVPLHFSLTSASVMNMFFVPQLGSMIATMNGMVTQLYLQADGPGDYFGESTQFSGDGFSDMNFTLHAVPAEGFDRWVAQARADGPLLDRAAYELLARQSAHVRPYTYRGIDSTLFQAVATQQLPPAPGPQQGRGGPGVQPRAGE
ncbi:MAG TPA: ubiquinol oxidase subunit II [Rhodocyclaceae bacterium]